MSGFMRSNFSWSFPPGCLVTAQSQKIVWHACNLWSNSKLFARGYSHTYINAGEWPSLAEAIVVLNVGSAGCNTHRNQFAGLESVCVVVVFVSGWLDTAAVHSLLYCRLQLQPMTAKSARVGLWHQSSPNLNSTQSCQCFIRPFTPTECKWWC